VLGVIELSDVSAVTLLARFGSHSRCQGNILVIQRGLDDEL
jgi:hypothetical protein